MSYEVGYRFEIKRGGLLLNATYVAVRQVGEGGFGAVFACRREKDGTVVDGDDYALKALLNSADAEDVERFKREGVVLANLEHENIVKIVAVIDEPHGPALVQEYIKGGRRLHQYLRREAGKSPERQLSVVLQALYGLRKAHESGVVHRDVTPANILVGPSGRVKVIDFGLAKHVGSDMAGLTRDALGTPWFMAPEQKRPDLGTDHRADIYGLGMSLMAVNNPTFTYPKVGPAVAEETEETPEPLPTCWLLIIDKMTRLNPSERYANVGEVVDAFVAAGIADGVLPDEFMYHLREMEKWSPRPQSFYPLCAAFLGQETFEINHLVVATLLGADGAAAVGLNPRDVLKSVWEKVIFPLFPLEGVHRHNYEQMHYVNEFARTWWDHMDVDWQDFAFGQLTRLALRYNRYPSMDLLRSLYGKANPGRRTKLKAIKDEADPTGYIRNI